MLSTRYWYDSRSPVTSWPTVGITANEYTSYLQVQERDSIAKRWRHRRDCDNLANKSQPTAVLNC